MQWKYDILHFIPNDMGEQQVSFFTLHGKQLYCGLQMYCKLGTNSCIMATKGLSAYHLKTKSEC
jgi:hypothetical protein